MTQSPTENAAYRLRSLLRKHNTAGSDGIEDEADRSEAEQLERLLGRGARSLKQVFAAARSASTRSRKNPTCVVSQDTRQQRHCVVTRMNGYRVCQVTDDAGRVYTIDVRKMFPRDQREYVDVGSRCMLRLAKHPATFVWSVKSASLTKPANEAST